MSWSFSPGLVAAFSEASCSDTGPSAPLNMTHMPDQFYWPDKPTEHSRISRFGMTCEPLTGGLGTELLTWFREGSRARTSAWQETGPDWTARGLGYGEKWLGLLAKYDPATSTLKTAQCSFLEDSIECLLTLPRSGLMLDGECYQLPMLVPPISESESGYWPTPQTRFGTNDGDLAALARMCDSSQEFNQMAYRAAAKKKATFFPTPTTQDNAQVAGQYATNGTTLAGFVRMFPTATATAAKGSSPASLTRKNGKSREFDRLDHFVEANPNGATGRLNPVFCEWLMGWPLGQTELKPLETARFLEFVQQHGDFLEAPE
jgi:hypothetical protein